MKSQSWYIVAAFQKLAQPNEIELYGENFYFNIFCAFLIRLTNRFRNTLTN